MSNTFFLFLFASLTNYEVFVNSYEIELNM